MRMARQFTAGNESVLVHVSKGRLKSTNDIGGTGCHCSRSAAFMPLQREMESRFEILEGMAGIDVEAA
jgi:hypothetical protein